MEVSRHRRQRVSYKTAVASSLPPDAVDFAVLAGARAASYAMPRETKKSVRLANRAWFEGAGAPIDDRLTGHTARKP